MRKLFSIKWEVIIAVLLFITALLSWSLCETGLNDWRIVALILIPTIMFIVWIINFNQIKEFRLLVRDLW